MIRSPNYSMIALTLPSVNSRQYQVLISSFPVVGYPKTEGVVHAADVIGEIATNITPPDFVSPGFQRGISPDFTVYSISCRIRAGL